MKTALWLYLFMFLAFFDLHAQYPVLTLFAVSLGAGPAFIGWMMGMYSLTHLPGNLLAGSLIDRKGSRRYIIGSLIAAGLLLLLQSYASLPWHLLLTRAFSGFALAFLSPACMALLASLSADKAKQGKYMSGNGIVHTLASVLSPAAGAYIVAKAGFGGTFLGLGWLLIATGVMAYFSLPKPVIKPSPQPQADSAGGDGAGGTGSKAAGTDGGENADDKGPAGYGHAPKPAQWTLSSVWKVQTGFPKRYFLLPFFTACAQGVLFFELPLSQIGRADGGLISTGALMSLISLGALLTLSLLFLNRLSPGGRISAALLMMALCFFGLAAVPALPIAVFLFVLGMSKGILFPATASLFIGLSDRKRLGRTFSLQSIATSLGSFAGPVLAGQLRDYCSPYFIAFLLLMTALLLLPQLYVGSTQSYRPEGNSNAA